MLTPKHIKEGKMLLKGVTKFVHYKRDVLSDEKTQAIEEKQQAFKDLLKTGTKEEIQTLAKELQKTCERSVPMPSHSGLRENVEVFFVAIVIALGIRSYFLQPFKIPTGSMQPTLNGIIAKGFDQSKEEDWQKIKPNILTKGWDLLWHGRNFVELRAKEDFVIKTAYQKNPLKFFSFTYIARETTDGAPMKPLKVWAPLDKTLADLGLGKAMGFPSEQARGLVDKGPAPKMRPVRIRNPRVRKGDLLVRGYVDTGDQVLVNKMSYHFRKPNRGEVFVFTTNGIKRIIASTPGGQSQHYIKRLCALPGDEFRIDEKYQLFIDGKRTTEPGNVRVMDRKPPYENSGYRRFNRDEQFNEGKLEDKQYLALGDNSPFSWDSRGWGPVPESNLVGSALFVYWPFAKHWGIID